MPETDTQLTARLLLEHASGSDWAPVDTERLRTAAGMAPPAPPPVVWKMPAEGAVVSGFMFDAATSGPSGPLEVTVDGAARVEFYANGGLLNVERAAPYNGRLDTTKLPNGAAVLRAAAFDTAGVELGAARRLITVNNVTAAATPAPTPAGSLVFEDDFSGDLSKWNAWSGPGHGGNGLRRASAVSIVNGQLVITATWDGSNIVSGILSPRMSDFTFGTMTFRCRVDHDPTLQMSGIVMLWPKNNSDGSSAWVPRGEQDIMETGSGGRLPVKTYLHRSQDGITDAQVEIRHEGVDGSEWHDWQYVWGPDAIDIVIDGRLSRHYTDKRFIPSGWPFHPSIQLDALSNRPLTGPVRMFVEYVRVYRP